MKPKHLRRFTSFWSHLRPNTGIFRSQGYKTPRAGEENGKNQPLASQFPYASEQENFQGVDLIRARIVEGRSRAQRAWAAHGPETEIDRSAAGRGPTATGAGRDACRTRVQLPRGQEHDFKAHQHLITLMVTLSTNRDFRAVQKLPFCYLCGDEFRSEDIINRDHIPPQNSFAVCDRTPPCGCLHTNIVIQPTR
jgi:hypothetical protein